MVTDLIYAGPDAHDYKANDKFIVKEFERHNMLVEGLTGAGKDLLFAHVIHLRDEKHYSKTIGTPRS